MSQLVTLIPAYKPDHLAELFNGLRTQTFKDFRVVLSDDSPGGTITEHIRGGAFDTLIGSLNLLVVQGPRQGSFKNVLHLLRHWGTQSPLVHLHMDDDVVYPDFYRNHVLTHASAEVGATVSQRWLTSADGRPAVHLPLPEFIDNHNERILAVGSDILFASTVPACQNWLGEFSNAVLSQEAVRRLQQASMQGLSYYGLADIGVLLDVSRHAPIGVIRDHLSGFRSHPQQATAQTQSFGLKCGYLAWMALALAAWREERITTTQAMQSIGITLKHCVQRYAGDVSMSEFFKLVETQAHDLSALHVGFSGFWKRLLQTDADSRDAVVATAEVALA